MTDISMHAASAPMFALMLNNLGGWLDKAEAHAAAKKFEVDVLLATRLAPDMLPLSGQIALATAFAKNAMCRLANQTPPDFPDAEKVLADHRARIARTIEIVNSFSAADLAGAATREVSVGVGPDTTLTMNGADYLFKFSLPNFYFHITTAYDILRHNGVELGKRDFLAGAI